MTREQIANLGLKSELMNEAMIKFNVELPKEYDSPLDFLRSLGMTDEEDNDLFALPSTGSLGGELQFGIVLGTLLTERRLKNETE